MRAILAAMIVVSAACWSSATRAENGTEPTRIAKPQGPGAIEGLGRNFVPSLASGTASYGIAIAVPPSAGGFAPQLALEYSAGSGISEVGLDFHIAGLPSVRRRVEDGLPRFDDSDAFELVGLGTPCDLLEIEPDIFRPQQETGSFVRVLRDRRTDTWQVQDKAGTTHRFGGEQFVEQEDGQVVTYLLREQEDRHGHVIRYQWDTEGGYALLRGVVWNDFTDDARQRIDLTYEGRPDAHDLFSSGIHRKLARRLATIEVTLGGSPVRSYELGYAGEAQSLLKRVQLVGAEGSTDLPPVVLSYTSLEIAESGENTVRMQSPPGRSPSEGDVALADLNGDALPEVLVAERGAYRTYVNLDGLAWETGTPWSAADTPSFALSAEGVQLADVDGDASIDLVAKSGTDGFRYFPGAAATRFGAAVSIASVPSFSFEDPEVRLADMDGDRRVDVVITTSGGLEIAYNLGGRDWSEPEALGPVDPQQPLRFSDGNTQLCDVNGDRVQDFCYLRPGALTYWLGRGRGKFEPARSATGVPDFEPDDPWRLVDLNGDGWVDLVYIGHDSISFVLATRCGELGAMQTITGVPEKKPTTTVELADMNGSGTTDLVWIDVSGAPDEAWRYLELFPEGRGGLLSGIDNGLGKVTRIEYEPAAMHAARMREAGVPWTTRMNVGMEVVTRVTVESSLGDAPLVTEYTYRDGTWDGEERTFAGFAEGTQTELGDTYTPTLVTHTTFDTGLEARVLRGAVRESEQLDAQGLVFTRSVRSYRVVQLADAMDGRSVEYGYAESEHVEQLERGEEGDSRTTLTEWEQDEFGNVLRESRWGEVDGADERVGDDEAITARTFVNDSEAWLLGLLATEETLDAAGNRLSLTRNYYDGEPFQGLPLGRATLGDVTRQEAWVGPEPDDFELVLSTRYDDDGRPEETRDARGGGRVYVWDDVDHTTLLSEQVKLEGAVELIEHVETDRRFGTVLGIADYNGAWTRFADDDLGRITKVIKPGDSSAEPTVRYVYEPGAGLSRISTEARVGDDVIEHSEALFDGLGRKRAELTREAEGRWVLAGVGLLDARGQVRKALRPRRVRDAEHDEPPLQEDTAGVQTSRDALGREIGTQSHAGITTRTEYAPLLTKHWDGGQDQPDPDSGYEGLPAEERVDGLGRTLSVTRYLEGKPLTSRFTWDAAGRLRSRTDAEGYRASYDYDGRGRRVEVDDPDLGHRVLTWDATSNLVAREDPDGHVVRYGFDLAGRPLTEDWDDDGKDDVTRTWDVAPDGKPDAHYLGKLARVDDPSGKTEQEYDERGRTTWTHVIVDERRYSSGSRYDDQDREVLHVYPDGSAIEIHRNALGQVSGYGDAVAVEYASDGLETQRRFDTGVVQELGYDDDRRLNELEVTAADGEVVEHLEWVLDAAGNLREQRDLREHVSADEERSETYGYNNLYWLTGVTGVWGETSWRYTPSGNLRARISTVDAQHAPEIAYGEHGAGPHAMTSYRGRSLTYDASGRMKSDGERTFDWNDVDQLREVHTDSGASVRNVFNAGGARRIRRERSADGDETTTVFLGPWSEVKDGKLVRYVVHGGRRIVRLSEHTGSAIEHPGAASTLGADRTPADGMLPGWTLAALALLACALLGSRPGRRPRTAALIAALATGSCSSDPAPDARTELPMLGGDAGITEGTVTELGEDDVLLFQDQIGSLLVETSRAGTALGRFAVYPYGATRYETLHETERYAGTPRDIAVNLDHMGARFYAPDLGVWISGDQALIDQVAATVGANARIGHPFAYASWAPTTRTDAAGFASRTEERSWLRWLGVSRGEVNTTSSLANNAASTYAQGAAGSTMVMALQEKEVQERLEFVLGWTTVGIAGAELMAEGAVSGTVGWTAEAADFLSDHADLFEALGNSDRSAAGEVLANWTATLAGGEDEAIGFAADLFDRSLWNRGFSAEIATNLPQPALRLASPINPINLAPNVNAAATALAPGATQATFGHLDWLALPVTRSMDAVAGAMTSSAENLAPAASSIVQEIAGF